MEHVQDSWVEVEHYSTWIKNKITVLIRAWASPHGVEVRVLFIASTSSFAH